MTKSGVANEIMLEMLNGYINAELTTNIDESVSVCLKNHFRNFKFKLSHFRIIEWKSIDAGGSGKWAQKSDLSYFDFVPKLSHTQAEEQEVEFEYGKSCEFPVTADDSSVQGQFDKISPVLIQSGTQIRDCRWVYVSIFKSLISVPSCKGQRRRPESNVQNSRRKIGRNIIRKWL